MRRHLLLPGMLAMLFAAAPASGQTWAAFHQWNFCSGNSLSVCMNFELTRNGSTNNYQLLIGYVSSLAPTGQTGVMTSAGLYRERRGVYDLNVTNQHIVSTTPTGVVWAIGSSQLNGGGSIVIEVAGNSNQGVNNGLPVQGSVLIGFTSSNLANYDIENLFARAHIQSYGVNECSLKPDSRAEDNVVDGAVAIDERCGTLTPPPPPEVVPEPITMVLLGSGLLGVGGMARRRKRKKDAEE